jgi:hypothetical protein
MSMRYKGGVISATPPTTSTASAKGVWTLIQQMQAQAAGQWPSTAAYQVSRSLRFNSADSARLTRTPASASNQKTWTWSGWVKRSSLPGSEMTLFSALFNGQNTFRAAFTSTNTLFFGNANSDTFNLNIQTTQVFRDPSAWYHIVIAVDTTQATSSNRAKLYVNGSQVTAFGTATYPSQNYDTWINSANGHTIGSESTISYYNGYMTEIHFVDGQALTPSSFGETNLNTGVWQPKEVVGMTYGTNGYYVNFSDNSNTTAATLGKDYSGNSNNWTPNNFSVTAGVNNDSFVDTPTPYGTDTGAGGTVRGNYATLNPLDNGGATITNGNLDWDSAGNQGTKASIFISTGKWYWEITSTESNLIGEHGVASASQPISGATAYPGASSTSWGFSNSSGNKSNNATFTNITSAGALNDVIMVAVDIDSGKIWWGRNGTWFSSGDPSTGANAAFTNLTGNVVTPMTGVGGAAAGSVTYNFGQRAFAYTAPSGFKALTTQNLTTPTIGATSTTLAGKYFNPVLYTGNGSSQSITGVGFQPDFTWIKSRSGADNHNLFNSVVGLPNRLFSNLTNAENTTAGTLTSFNSDGFSLGSISDVNANGTTFASWNWNAGGSTVTNTSGTISSQVRANTTSGFSIVTYTGTGATGGTVGHGLGVKPGMIIVKNRSTTGGWVCWQQALTGGNEQDRYIYLNLTDASATTTNYWGSGITSSTFGVWTTGGDNNNSGSAFVAYCFAPVAGYSAFGSYTGNGSADGPFVYTGFSPAFIMVKNATDSGVNWLMWDDKMNTYNVTTTYLLPNTSNSQFTDLALDMVSNGFKPRVAGGTGINQSGKNYIYMAFAENPFKYSLAR